MSDYPEHDKLSKISDQSQAIGEFLNWLADVKEVLLAQYAVESRICRNCDHEDPHEGEECGECGCDRQPVRNPDRIYPYRGRKTKLLAEFFGIDENRLEDEKRAMLDTMREANAR